MALRTPSSKLTTPPLRIEITAKTMFLIVAGLASVWMLIHLFEVILVVVVALFFVGTLSPFVEWLEKHKVKRGWGIALVFTAMLITTVLVAALTIPPLISQASKLFEQEPAIRGRLVDLLSRSRATASLADSLRNVHYDAIAKSAAGAAFDLSTRVVEIVAYSVSSVFLALYIMIDRDRLRGGLYALVPRNHHIRLARILSNLEVIVGGYIRGQVITSALMTVFVFILLMACGVENAIPLAVFAGLADVLPYIGVFLSVGPALLATLSHGVVPSIVVLGSMLAYEEFESRILVPRIYGNALRLPSSVVMIALLAGGTLMGILGALMALPVAAAIRMLVEELRVDLPGEDIDDEQLRTRDEAAEKEYERRAEGKPAERAAAIAVEIADKRMHEEGDSKDATLKPVTGGKHE